MRKITYIIIALLIISCGKEEKDLIVKGTIKGLKKGTIYLKRVKDTSLVTVDSLIVNGNSQFELTSDLESPEVFFLYLDKNSSENDRITFFADKGITEINTTVKNFVFDAKIIGSAQHEKLSEYRKIMSRLNDQNLNIIKENLEAQKVNDTSKLDSLQNAYESLIKRRYLYTVNFAINNKDSEVAPYLTLTEIYDAKIKFLDTINNSLTNKVKASKYGKQLQTFIDKVKASNE
jgi:succinate dehydrogenase flavin-adding protein (antitoxin of CptAB toxin-antitoxin module)